MTMCADQAPRANRDGSPCPPWCDTDHAKYGFHGAERITIQAPRYRSVGVRPVMYPGYNHDRPGIQLAGDGVLYVRLDDAPDLAALIEQLATATPAQHHQVAAAIRQAAAIAGAQDEPGPAENDSPGTVQP